MEVKKFKEYLKILSKEQNFDFLFNGWFKESEECIAVLDLQKSNFRNLYYLNIKIYIQGIFGKHYIKSRNLLKDTGDIFCRQPAMYKDVLNFEDDMTSETSSNCFIFFTSEGNRPPYFCFQR
jgi:hypothetical protein